MELRGVVNECYILQDRLGEDSQCEIVRASAMFAATRFMLRFFKPGIPSEGIEAFRALTLAAYGVQHQAIIDVVELDRAGDRYFVSSEYGAQAPLRAVLAGAPSFPLEHICRFVLELAEGLDAFHQRGLAYGTLDADSVWVGRDAGTINELRFLKPGYLPLVPYLDRTDPSLALERFGYLAPETKGVDQRPVDQRSDVYSLGVHLYRFLTGLLPFRGQSARRAMDKAVSVLHVANALTRRDVPRELIRIALTCLRRNPRQRYPGAVELIADLRGFLDARRQASALSGMADPLEALATLNEGRKKVGAEQFVRTLETAEYFKDLIASTPRPGEGSAPSTRFPTMFLPTDEKEAKRLLDLEELESEGPDDDESLDVEALLDRSRAIVEAERSGRRTAEPERSDAESAHSTYAGALGMPEPGSAPQRRETQEPLVTEGAKAEKMSSRPSDGVGQATGSGAVIAWRMERIRLDAAAASLLDAFEGARRGKGAFRFVELPGDGQALAVVRRALDIMAESGFLVDAGSCAGDGRLFAPRLIASLRRIVEGRPGRERGRMRARLDDLESALRIPEQSLAELGGGKADVVLDTSAAALAGFGRRGKPLVLVAGDAEKADRNLHGFLLRLASLAAERPLLVLMFHERGQAPSWHVLSGAAGRSGDEPGMAAEP